MGEQLIFKAIAEAQKEMSALGKTDRNDFQKFNFRGIDSVYNYVHPVMAKHGIFSVPEVLEEKTEERKSSKGGALIYRILKIQYTFYTTDGSSVKSVVVGEGMDSGDKAANKAMAIGHKYALVQLFSIPTDEKIDPDFETPPASAPIKPTIPDTVKPADPVLKRIQDFAFKSNVPWEGVREMVKGTYGAAKISVLKENEEAIKEMISNAGKEENKLPF